MATGEAPDEFEERLKRQILDAYGFESEAELGAAVEEALPGYLVAHAEFEAERAAFLAELPARMREVAAKVTAQLQAQGMLPDGVEIVPIDLQADAQWMAQGPIVVDYATDRPSQPLLPNAPELTEEQKQAAAEAASTRIEEWRRQWQTGVLGYDYTPPPISDPPPFVPLSNPWRDEPRSRDYPVGG